MLWYVETQNTKQCIVVMRYTMRNLLCEYLEAARLWKAVSVWNIRFIFSILTTNGKNVAVRRIKWRIKRNVKINSIPQRDDSSLGLVCITNTYGNYKWRETKKRQKQKIKSITFSKILSQAAIEWAEIFNSSNFHNWVNYRII